MVQAYRLSQRQKRLIAVLKQLPACFAQSVVRLGGPVDRDRLRNALADIANHHEILRTVYRLPPGTKTPVQVVEKWSSESHGESEILSSQSASHESCIQRLLANERQAVADIDRGPLFRSYLATLSDYHHVLILTAHGLCADRRSLDNILAQTIDRYGAASPVMSRNGAVSYFQFAEWQRALSAKDTSQAETGHGLKNNRDGSRLPLRRDSRSHELRAGSSFKLDGARLTQFLQAARAADVTPGVLLLACWIWLLWRLTDRACVSCGWVAAGRPLEELAPAVGLFSTSLPLYFEVPGDLMLAAWARHVAQVLREAEARESGVGEGGGGDSEPEVSFEFADSLPPRSVGPLRFVPERSETQLDVARLQLSCVRFEDCLEIQLGHDAQQIRHDDAVVLLGQLESVIERSGTCLDAPLNRLPASDTSRRKLKSRAVQGLPSTRPPQVCWHELFESQVALRPDAPGVVFEGRRLSYAELNARADCVAARLPAAGTECIVALCAEPSPEMVAALLGILKAGSAALGLDPAQPCPRLRLMLQDCQPSLVLAQRSIANVLPEHTCPLLFIDDLTEPDAVRRPAQTQDPAQLAYVIYTSGTTGRPKGIAVEHTQIVNYVQSIARRFGFEAGASHALLSTISADIGYTSLFGALATGGCLHLLRREVVRDAQKLVDYLRDNRIDFLKLTPSHLEVLLASGLGREAMPRRTLILGGEGASRELFLDEFASLGSACAIFNHYGPSETTVGVLTHRLCDEDRDRPTITLPLDETVEGTETYVLDPALRSVPTWHPGELCIGGAALARGYLGRPDLTAASFVPNPYARDPGGRLYRTGDRARHWPDGTIEVLGRNDEQIKLRGYRIEAGEVESAIQQHPLVERAVVLSRGDRAIDQRLVACIVPRCPPHAIVDDAPTCELPNGLVVLHHNKNETDYLYEEIFRRNSYLQHGVRLDEGACVFDVGANIGMFSLFASLQAPGSRIYAFEPLPPIFETMRRNLEAYNPGAKAFCLGMSDRPQEQEFFYFPRHTMMSGLGEYAEPEQEVEVVRTFLQNARRAGQNDAEELFANVDELLEGRFRPQRLRCRLTTLSQAMREQGVTSIDLLKIDVQRAELDVLNGIKESDWPKIRQIAMELHDAEGRGTEGRMSVIRSLLADRGFAVEVEQDPLLRGTDRYSLYAVRDAVRSTQSVNAVNDRVLTPRAPAILSSQHLRGFVASHLPDYMVPSEFAFVEALPLRSNGKLDREAVAAMSAEHARAAIVPPRNESEQTICAIWAELLNRKAVGVFDNFFDLGGHSLLVMLALSRMREAFGAEIPIREFFETPTVAGLAEFLLQLDARSESRGVPEQLVAGSRNNIDQQLAKMESATQGGAGLKGREAW